MRKKLAGTEKKRNNHYVPRMYLRQWSNNGNTVWTYDTIVRDERQKVWESKAIGGLAYWRDFYTQIGDDDTIDDSIETLFGDKYESPAGNALKKVRGNEALTPEDMSVLVDFAILQMVRTPAWYRKISREMPSNFLAAASDTLDGLEKAYKSGMLASDGTNKQTGTPPNISPFPQWDIGVDVDEDAAEIAVTMTVGRKSYLASVGRILNGDVGKLMRGYPWSVIEMPDGIVLPTSDNPFVRLSVGRDGSTSLDGGVGMMFTDLFMPLTPKHLLFTEVGGSILTPRRLVDEPWILELITKSIVQNAMRYVYDCRKSGWIVKLRPRRVDPEYCNRMADAMRNWNETQD